MPFHTENADTFLFSSVRIPKCLIQARKCQEGNNEVERFNQFCWLRFYALSAAIIKIPLATNLIRKKPAIITNLFNVYWLLDFIPRKNQRVEDTLTLNFERICRFVNGIDISISKLRLMEGRIVANISVESKETHAHWRPGDQEKQ